MLIENEIKKSINNSLSITKSSSTQALSFLVWEFSLLIHSKSKHQKFRKLERNSIALKNAHVS